MGNRGARDTSPPPDKLLGLAVERSYRAFAHNQIGPVMVVRRGEVTTAEVTALSGPIRSVAAASVDRWLPHAVTTWGTAEDLRALLPRVFELLTAGLLDTPPEVLFAKLRHADISGWPLEEQAAVDDVVAAMWLATLAQHPSPMAIPAGRLLTAFAELGRDLSPYLDDWLRLLSSQAPEAAPARRHLGDLARQVQGLRQSGLDVAALFWRPHPEEVRRLETWLASPFITRQLPG